MEWMQMKVEDLDLSEALQVYNSYRAKIVADPASVVRGPKHVIKRGKTPVLSPEEARELFNGISTDTLIGLRDRALIGVLIYSFARVSAAVSMRVEDYFPQGERWWVRLHEKGGKHHEMPVHHTLEEYLDAYIEAAGLKGEPKARCSGRQTGRRVSCLTDLRQLAHGCAA